MEEKLCPVCGRAFTQRRRTKMYCSTRCCHKANRDARKRNAPTPPRLCAMCGQAIPVIGGRTKYCSEACRKAGTAAKREARVHLAPPYSMPDAYAGRALCWDGLHEPVAGDVTARTPDFNLGF